LKAGQLVTDLLLIACNAISSLFGILSKRNSVQNAFTVGAFETLWVINLSSSAQNPSFDCFTAFAAFFERGFITALAVWIISIHNNKFATMKIFIALEADKTFDMEVVAHCGACRIISFDG